MPRLLPGCRKYNIDLMSVRDMPTVGSFQSLCHTLLVDVMKFRAYRGQLFVINHRECFFQCGE